MLSAVALAGWGLAAQAVPEVRQIVTFKFRAGQAAEADRVYLDALVPVYRDARAVIRLRAFREAESPEPLDLVLVTTLRGLAGMDDLNEHLRGLAAAGKTDIGRLYRQLSDMSEFHHDQFVEMMPALAVERATAPRIWVFEWIRAAPGTRQTFRELAHAALVPWERAQSQVRASETGRLIVTDAWDFLRFLGFDTLAGYHEYLTGLGQQPFALGLEQTIAARKVVVLRPDDRFSVR